jgi:hypothetical protein
MSKAVSQGEMILVFVERCSPKCMLLAPIEVRDLGKVLKSSHGEQGASSQIILQGTGDLALPRTAPKCPF